MIWCFCGGNAVYAHAGGDGIPVSADTSGERAPEDKEKYTFLSDGSLLLTEEVMDELSSGKDPLDYFPGCIEYGESDVNANGDLPVFYDLSEAAAYHREMMVNREERVAYSIVTDDEEFIRSFLSTMFNASLEHTGKGDEGDYIFSHLRSYSPSGVVGDGMVTCAFHYTYRSTYEQETAVSEEIPRVLEDLDLEGKSEFEKFYEIYYYVTRHVVYDYDHLGDESYQTQFTAYGALIDGKAVCQGYATLLYRMLLEAGIDCRYISGGRHAWNIVRIGDLYYNADPTWDATGSTERYCEGYCLKSEAAFESSHDRDERYRTPEFTAAYPMAQENYPLGAPGTVFPFRAMVDYGSSQGYGLYERLAGIMPVEGSTVEMITDAYDYGGGILGYILDLKGHTYNLISAGCFNAGYGGAVRNGIVICKGEDIDFVFLVEDDTFSMEDTVIDANYRAVRGVLNEAELCMSDVRIVNAENAVENRGTAFLDGFVTEGAVTALSGEV